MRELYQTEGNENAVGDTLEEMVREGARRMLAAALENEVSRFLGRDRYERGDEFRRYRNGYHPSRELTVGVSAVEVKVPRVSDVPAEVSPDAGPVSEAVPGGVVHRGLRARVQGACGRDGSAESERDREAEAEVGGGVQGMALKDAE